MVLQSAIIIISVLPAWEVTVTRQQGQEGVNLLSRTTGVFSVELCVKSEESTVCKITETHTVHVVSIT